jgi:hypothetical protein
MRGEGPAEYAPELQASAELCHDPCQTLNWQAELEEDRWEGVVHVERDASPAHVANVVIEFEYQETAE